MAETHAEGFLVLANEIDRLRKIEALALKMMKAKGRYHTQLATCELGEALGLSVIWPENAKASNAGIQPPTIGGRLE